VVVVGATGNVGSSLVARLSGDDRATSVVGVARRPPQVALPKVEWRVADIRHDDLAPILRGVDAVVSLAWLIQPSKHPSVLASVNVGGSRRVFEATAEAGVPALVYASSVGAYSRGPKDRAVDESWPTGGVPSCSYSRDKATVERILDGFERQHPRVRTVRLRPGLVFKRTAGAEITRYFLGWPAVGRSLPRRLPVLPFPRGLAVQGVHSHDLADAYAAAIFRDVRGAFNVAAEPVIDAHAIASHSGMRTVGVPPRVVRGAMSAAWHAGLQPTDPSWLDMAMDVPVMDCSRARSELGWRPVHSSMDAVAEVLGGVRDQTGLPTPSLRPS
jgi:UDP-glucose 4-epimerase